MKTKTWGLVALAVSLFTFSSLIFTSYGREGGSGNSSSSSSNYDISLTSLQPNLVNVSPGQKLNINLQVKNKRNTDATNFDIEIYLSKAQTIDQNAIKIATQTIQFLEAGQSLPLSLSITIPSNITAGIYYLIAKANWVQDQNLTNNTTSSPLNEFSINTTSSGLAVISIGNQDIAFIPNRENLIPIPLNPNTTINFSSLKTQQVSCNKIGNQGWVCSVPNLPTASFKLDSCSADPIAKKVVCIGNDSQKIAIFDISKYLQTQNPIDIQLQECNLDPKKYINYKNMIINPCRNCGVVTDPGDNRFIVSSGDGFRVVGYNILQDGSCKIQKTYLLSRYNIFDVIDNFAYDPTRDWILSPESYIPSYSHNEGAKFWIIDVKNDKVYKWEKKISCSNLAPPKSLCMLFGLDSVSIDPSTGIVIISDKNNLSHILVDLGQAKFNTSTNTFNAPYTMVYLPSTYASNALGGVSIEPSSHIAFLVENLNHNIAVLQLPSTSGTGGSFPTPPKWTHNSLFLYLIDVCDSNPGDGFAGYIWHNREAPSYGLSVFKASINGTSYGVLLSRDKSCVAIVDLKKLLFAPKKSDYSQVDFDYDLFSNNVLYFIKIKVK